MRNFLFFILKLLTIVLISAIMLDLVYSKVYMQSEKRNKIQLLINGKDKNYDVIFMGSSRTNNHMVAKIFNEKGLKSFNFGMSGSKLEETALMLKLMLNNNYKIKTIFLDVDLNINSNTHSNGTRALFMPYLHSSKIIQDYYKNLPDYTKLFYLPFYRYFENDSKIGFRELFFTLLNKKTNTTSNFGYYPLKNEGENLKFDLSDYNPKKNIAYEEIKLLCKQNNIHLIAISTPMCQECDSDDYFNKINSIYPEVYNYESKITEDYFFSSCGHLNEKGATQFTTILLNDYLQHKFKN